MLVELNIVHATKETKKQTRNKKYVGCYDIGTKIKVLSAIEYLLKKEIFIQNNAKQLKSKYYATEKVNSDARILADLLKIFDVNINE